MDEVNDQIDRLNFALQQVMDKIGNTSVDRTPRVSITNSNWLDDASDNSLDIPDNFEARFEQILQELDRSNMIVEDLQSQQFRNVIKLTFTKPEVKSLINSLNRLFSGGHCAVRLGSETYNLTLHPNETLLDEREVTVIENSILDCGHDITKIRREIAIDVERKLQAKKNLIVEKAKASFEAQLEEIEKLKQSYLDKMKDMVLFSNQLEKREMSIELKELRLQKTQSEGLLPENLEEKLKSLETVSQITDFGEESRVALKIEKIKNKISNMRVEKVISESKQTSSVLYRVVKAMAHEVSSDEKQRKKVLEKYTESQKPSPSELERVGLSTLKRQEENFRAYMEKARIRLKEKENEVREKERVLEEKWMIIPGSKELIEMTKTSLEKINLQAEENEHEREILEREKLDIINLNEKIAKIFVIFEAAKKGKNHVDFENARELIGSLNLKTQQLEFH